MQKWAGRRTEGLAEISLLAAQLPPQRSTMVGRKPFVELILTGATFAERAVERAVEAIERF